MPFERLTTLSRAVDEHLADHGMRTRTIVFNLCIEAVSFAREAEALIGVRARSAARLLLELACPELDEAELDALARACQRAAVPG
jgi:hypothetical protein